MIVCLQLLCEWRHRVLRSYGLRTEKKPFYFGPSLNDWGLFENINIWSFILSFEKGQRG
jgi:hypothetical protein